MSVASFHYNIFGLHARSDLELMHLYPVKESSKIEVNFQSKKIRKPSPHKVEHPSTGIRKIKKDYFYLEIHDVGIFEVFGPKNGTTNVFYQMINPDKKITFFNWLFGSVIAAVLHLNDKMIIHSSATVFQDKLHLFCGQSGIGKSTIAAKLFEKGYPIFSDDKTVISWNKKLGEFEAEPSLPIMRLWVNSIDNIKDQSILQKGLQLSQEEEKFQFLIKEKNQIKEKKTIAKIFVIRNVSSELILKCKKLQGNRKIQAIKNQIFRLNFLFKFEKSLMVQSFVQKLIQQCDVHVVRRPDGTSIDEFTNFMENLIVSGALDKNL